MDEDGYYVSPDILGRLGDGDVTKGRRALRMILDLEAAHPSIMGPTEKPVNVRAAIERDEEAILDLIRLDIAENARHIAPINEDKIMAQVRVATRKGEATIGVIDSPTGLAGMICLIPWSWWWSDQWFVQEMFSFVHPEHRSSRHAADLIKFSRWFADDLSAKVGYRVYLVSGVTATRHAAPKMAVYRRLLNRIGAFYAYPDPGIP